MRPIILRAGLAIAMVAAFLACRDDGVDPNATGNIVLQVVLGETEHPNAAGAAPDGTQPVAAVPGEALTHLDSAKATITGPTTQTITLTRGATNFTGSFSSIPVGTYTVVVAGYDLNAVDYYGRTTGVGVTAGQTATPTITFSSFVPGGTGQAFTGVPGTTTAFRLNAAFSIVANADSYRVELANNTGFNPVAAGAWLRQSPALVTVSGIGTWYLRVRAANAAAPSGGNWSANTQFQVVTDQRTSGDTPGSAPNLGFFATTTQTLDSLNISPATDVDWFSLNQCNGDEIIISAQALRLSPSSPLNPELRVYSTAGLLIAQNDDSGGTNTDGFVRLLHTYDNAYKVRVSGSGNTTGHYRLRLEGKAGANNATSSCRVVTLAVSNIAAGFLHACAVRSTGVTDCWGNNGNGQLGNGTTTISSSPVRVSGSQTLQTVTAGSFHSCGRTSGGAAYCWGSNAGGQLGDGTTMQRETPVPVSTTQSFVYLGAGDRFTCGLTGGGAAYCWGDNGAGQLGTGNNTNSNTPVPVTGSHTFVSLAVGQFHACGNRSDGAVYCWGGGGRGQLGNGVFSNSNTPVLVSGSGSTLVLQGVAANGDQTCARTNPGNAAYCWGRNASGQLGDGTFTDQAIPVAVAGGYVFAHLAPGRFHTCGYRTDGVPMCWGSNFDGQLGDGTTFLRSTPAVVSGGLVFQQMAGGAYHTCAWTSSNLAYCWGWNGFGQLGDAGAFNHTGPIPVSGTLALRSLSTNNQHTCGVTTSGST
ncbi:MAG: hypothetical protein HY560_10085, partial [Gemmatimonadetes bacterium]|nr:hypothetical protein [Gemmatimonadota bacterium]